MSTEQEIQQELLSKFFCLTDKIKIPRVRRISVEIGMDRFNDVLDYIVHQLKFSQLHTITALDEGANFGLIYHLGKDNTIVLNLKTTLPKNKPTLKTIIGIFPNAEIYERELVDLFGIQVEGLEAGNRYPLTDDWPIDSYPLRKDWKGV